MPSPPAPSCTRLSQIPDLVVQAGVRHRKVCAPPLSRQSRAPGKPWLLTRAPRLRAQLSVLRTRCGAPPSSELRVFWIVCLTWAFRPTLGGWADFASGVFARLDSGFAHRRGSGCGIRPSVSYRVRNLSLSASRVRLSSIDAFRVRLSSIQRRKQALDVQSPNPRSPDG